MRKIVLFVFCCYLSTPLFAQKTISGRLVSTKGIAIPYVNIGIKDTQTATVSDDEGNFTLQIPVISLSDTLSFSSIGYENRNIAIPELLVSSAVNIVLKEKITSLRQVNIFNRKKQRYRLGRVDKSNLIFYPSANFEQGRLLQIKEPVTVLNANIYIPTPLTTDVKVRINFYSLTNDLPGERVVEKSIIRNSLPRKKGWQKFDLSDEHIQLDRDFVVSFEFLSTKKQKIGFNAKRGAKDSYVRFNALAKWQRNLASDCTMYVTVEN